jgi:serine/threonine-protein kinase
MIRVNQRLGKYKIERRLGEGGFATVFRARDTVEGIRVALKILAPQYTHAATLDDFRREVRMVAKLKHPNILPLKNADMIDGHFVMAFPMGKETLGDRLGRRLSSQMALDYLHQLLGAAAHAHANKVIHCDIKPDNLILFPNNELLLTDFGIAKVAQRTVAGSGAGTVGHVAPEQAMGRPSFRSDVFSIGLIGYRMFSGTWPEWPFTWPPPAFARLQQQLQPDFIQFLRRAIEVDEKNRFRDAVQMLATFKRIRPRALRRRTASVPTNKRGKKDWRSHRIRQFKKQFGTSLGPFTACEHCSGPVVEPMMTCPWCRHDRTRLATETKFPQCCPRCYRGMKLDWKYCAWCYGGGFEVETTRRFTDVRYVETCRNKKCGQRTLMPFMRYCPQCSRKTNKKWRLKTTTERCHSCTWGITKDYWTYCPWCSVEI